MSVRKVSQVSREVINSSSTVIKGPLVLAAVDWVV